MKVYEPGVLETSNLFIHTPSSQAKKIFFHLLCTGHYFCNEKYVVNRINYDSYLIMYIVKGKGYLDISNRIMPLSGGSFALVDCYKPHRYYTDSGWETLWIHFDGILAREYFEIITKETGNVITPQNPYAAQRCLEKIYAMFSTKNKENEAVISQRITNILTEFILVANSSGKQSGQTAIIEEIIDYISENIADQLSLGELAKRASLSPFYFCRIFKQETGYTPHEYILHTRINTSRFFLKTTGLPIKEIAFKCGFTSESGFCTAFKKALGVTPLTYRNSGT